MADRRLRRHAPSPASSGLLGRASPRASLLYRVLLGASRIGARILRFRLVLEGAEHLPKTTDGHPAGAWIAAGMPHRTWIDPFVLALLLPIEPRLHFFGDGPTIYRSRLRRIVLTRIGGIIPIWPGSGSRGFEEHVAAARQVIDAGGVFTLFPEVGPPSALGKIRRLSPGVAYFALRTGAPIVPLVIGGNDELFLGKGLRLRVLPSVTARELCGLAPEVQLPEPGTSAERDLARRMTEELAALVAAPVAEVHAVSAPPQGARKRWRWLTNATR